jgi:hypothetical protein
MREKGIRIKKTGKNREIVQKGTETRSNHLGTVNTAKKS